MDESTEIKSSTLNKLQQLKQKVVLINDDISFLKRCKKNKIFPKFIKINIPIKNKVTEKVLANAKINWLNLEIKYLYSKQANLKLQAYEQHLLIIKNLNYVQFHLFEVKYTSILESIEYKHIHKRQKLNIKFDKLLQNNKHDNITSYDFSNQILIKNLSTQTFDNEELNLLEKGLNFNLKPLNYKEELFVDIETNLKQLNNQQKTAIRSDLSNIMRNENIQKYESNNLNHNICNIRIVKKLKEKNVFYLRADKSNTVVILDKEEYYRRVNNMLTDGPYITVRKNPINKFITSTSTSLKECNLLIKKDFIRRLTVNNPTMPRLYCLPKIHKLGDKMRPIVSSINAPNYLVSKWLVDRFKILPKYPSLSIKDRFDFISQTKNFVLEQNEYFVSFDVTSLYPNIPMSRAIDNLKDWLLSLHLSNKEVEEYLILTNLCINQNVFKFQDKFYKQTEGTAMGNPLSCLIADIFMSNFEIFAKNNLPYFPRLWLRYVDDVFAIFDKRQDLQEFVIQLNSYYQTIKFTYEIEENNTLPFLDILVKKNQNNHKIEFEIHRKPTANYRYIPNDSFHPYKQKIAVFQSMVHRLLNTPLTHSSYTKELKNIKEIAIFNGYPAELIDKIIMSKNKQLLKKSRTTLLNDKEDNSTWKSINYCPIAKKVQNSFKNNSDIKITFSTNNKLKYLLQNPKDKILEEEKSGIYKIECNNCEKIYIGQTKRKLKTRYKEHQTCFKYQHLDRSAIAAHSITENHSFKNVKLLKECNNPNKLDAYETLFINKFKNVVVNSDTGPVQNSPFL